MNQFLEDLAKQRRKFLEGLDANKGDINLDIFEDFYPDQAHFVYELLQNAEDAGATQARFELKKNGCLFEHNGTRAFDESDVRAITGIHNSTKSKSSDQIGKFGVGFKSVFVYTLTPEITSGQFAFRISRLVMPEPIQHKPIEGNWTRFWLPFDNPKKSLSSALSEIEGGLNSLGETTLLFLSNIESITWKLRNQTKGEVLRITHSEHHIEILKEVDGETMLSAHYLRFNRPVEGLSKQHVAIAFELDFLPKTTTFQANKPLAQQFRIAPAKPGRVSVFFPAEKETSGLRFHLHGPFVPELSRASIKETPANHPLFHQLADLSAASLHSIRDLNLLTADFLAVLPNPQDTISKRYDGIRNSIVNEMNEKSLTPTYSRSYAPAKHLFQAKASLKNIISVSDLKFLIGQETKNPQWAIGAPQKNSDVDRFISGLAIRKFDIEDFLTILKKMAGTRGRMDSENSKWVIGPDTSFMAWLASHSFEWHQILYAILHRELDHHSEIHGLQDVCLVRLNSGKYEIGKKCYFPTDGNEQDAILPRVAKDVYSFGKSKSDQESARKFLEQIGVREVSEADQVEAILKQRYCQINLAPLNSDLNRFFTLVEKDPGKSDIFKDYWIFKRDDNKWGKPSQVYLDAPYLDTGLRAYYEALAEKGDRVGLSRGYQDDGISTKRLVEFAKRVGVVSDLIIEEVSCRKNPDVYNLVYRAPGSVTSYEIDKDYEIRLLDVTIEGMSESLSLLVWRTCANQRYPDWTKARYRSNRNHPTNEAPSQLVVLLRDKKWIPQKGGSFVCPRDAVPEKLPKIFDFDSDWLWLKAIQFGESITKQSLENIRKREVARELGFDDDDSLSDAKWFAALDPEERKKFKVLHESKFHVDLPDYEPSNPERRATRVQEQASDAPERLTEKRIRSVSIGRESVKKETDPYLRAQYTNSDGEMICQVCKAALPFKLSDGNHYFEAVEFLPGLKKRHYQNYLALCPNHAAMFKHANGTTEEMKDFFLEIESNELDVVLAEEDASIYFTRTHIVDLKALIEMDDSDSEDD